MSTRAIIRGLALAALVLGAACATKSSTSLTDGRPAIPAPPTTTPKSSPPGAGDAGIHLPPEGAAQPLPQVTSIAPSRALVDGIAPTVSIQGSNFVPRTTIQVDGVVIPSSFVSDSEMRATLDATVLGQPGTHPFVAVTPAPGGGSSAPATFTVENPLATVTTLAPNAVLASAADTTVTITGSNFVKTSTASINGFALATTFTSATSLSALIPSAKLVVAGAAPIVVTNPAPGGGASLSLSFTIANPTVTVSAIAPSTAIVGAPATAITATGTGFVAASVISFNGAPIATTFASATSLTATIPAASLTAVGNFPVIVTNPAPGGGVSLPFTFVVGNPTPAITSITPAGGTVGDPPTTVTIDGTGFVAASQVAFGSTASATTFVSATEVEATLTATQLATAGTIAVTVVNPAPGGGTSNATTFTVDNPTPTLTSIAPASVAAGSGDTPLVAYGTGFVSGSAVQANGAALATTYVSATELQATVPAASLIDATTIAITVANPDPGASTSGAQTLTVTDAATGDDDGGASCDSTGVNVVLDSTGSPISAPLTYALGPTLRYAYNPADTTTFTCPVVNLSVYSTAYAAVVVQNTSGVAAYLEANADCASTDDAFLAVYANTDSIPTASADRKACTGYVANGDSGGGGLTSTNANGSDYCPGLTSANGGAVTLQPCDKAVLIVQPYNLAQFTAPATLGVQLTTP